MKDFVKGKKVFVGLSGGVDSAVSAALLARAGAQVTGVFIKGWYPPGMPCTWALDRRDAMRVAAKLHIPFRTLDASVEYKKGVIEYLLAEYRAGRTPNPDVMCNREVKFGVFYRYAIDSGADYIATGHYRAGSKDQSYFLWAVPREALARTLFPVGEMEKSAVRALATEWGLPVAEKKDSQGICFLGSVSVKEFLESELGTDDASILRTIGERVDGRYVTGKRDGALLFAEAGAPLPEHASISFTEANWLREPADAAAARYRYRGPLVAGRVEGNQFVLSSPLPEPVAPGQSLVFYRGEEMVGGGIIA